MKQAIGLKCIPYTLKASVKSFFTYIVQIVKILNVEEYISSGIVESYVLGITDERETYEFEQLMSKYPQIQSAKLLFETELENKMVANAVPPPAHVWNAVQSKINREQYSGRYTDNKKEEETVIPLVSASNNHIKVHKNFRYAFIAIVILSKVFLYASIYYYLLYKDELKQRVRLEQQFQQSAPAR